MRSVSALKLEQIDEQISQAGRSREPEVTFLKRVQPSGHRLGVFASSFNPVTCAHLELMQRAASQYALDEMLALAGTRNADKTQYECPLNERLQMLLLSTAEDPRLSVGLSSSAFFVDMVDAIGDCYRPATAIYFIVGLDTFERILDPEDRYTASYHRQFRNRDDALAYLLARCHLMVAGRKGRGAPELKALMSREPEMSRVIPDGRVLFMDFPRDFSERSSSEVRERLHAALSITGLVPPAAERYIQERGLYKK